LTGIQNLILHLDFWVKPWGSKGLSECSQTKVLRC
jgi:hypothetical protein